MAERMRKCKLECCGKKLPQSQGVQVPAGWFCSFDHVVEFAKAKQAKQRQRAASKAKQTQANARKIERAKHRQAKESIKSAEKIRKEAQTWCNKCVRFRDRFEPCISCNKSNDEVERDQGWKVGGAWDAGHYMSRGAKGQLRFYMLNIHKQCKSCNGGSGKFSHKAASVGAQYRVNLIKKIGIKNVEWLENNNELEYKKNDKAHLRRVREHFKRKYKRMVKEAVE